MLETPFQQKWPVAAGRCDMTAVDVVEVPQIGPGFFKLEIRRLERAVFGCILPAVVGVDVETDDLSLEIFSRKVDAPISGAASDVQSSADSALFQWCAMQPSERAGQDFVLEIKALGFGSVVRNNVFASCRHLEIGEGDCVAQNTSSEHPKLAVEGEFLAALGGFVNPLMELLSSAKAVDTAYQHLVFVSFTLVRWTCSEERERR